MEKPLIIRPMRLGVVASVICAILGVIYMVFSIFVFPDMGWFASLIFALIALFMMALAVWGYLNSLTTFALFDDGIFVFENGHKIAYEPWSKYTQAFLVRVPKGPKFIVLATEKANGEVFRQNLYWRGKVPRSEYIAIGSNNLPAEQKALLEKMVNEKVGPIVRSTWVY